VIPKRLMSFAALVLFAGTVVIIGYLVALGEVRPPETSTEVVIVSITPTSTPHPILTDILTSTDTPTPTSVATPTPTLTPTATPAPTLTLTATPTPSPSATSTSTATYTPTSLPPTNTPAATPTPTPPPPILIRPEDGGTVDPGTLLEWVWDGKLGPGQCLSDPKSGDCFSLRVWKEGEDPCFHGQLSETKYMVESLGSCRSGPHFWQVVVARKATVDSEWEEISDPSDTWQFFYNKPEEGGDHPCAGCRP
jgi:hypothetical protein